MVDINSQIITNLLLFINRLICIEIQKTKLPIVLPKCNKVLCVNMSDGKGIIMLLHTSIGTTYINIQYILNVPMDDLIYNSNSYLL